MDWTDSYGRKKLSDLAEVMISEITQEIHSKSLSMHTTYELTVNELGMLYRWPLYVGINIFIERLVRTLYDRDRGLKTLYDGSNYKPL